MFKERWLLGHRMAKRSYSTFKVRRGGGEEIPTAKVRETPVRRKVLREGIRGQTD